MRPGDDYDPFAEIHVRSMLAIGLPLPAWGGTPSCWPAFGSFWA